MTQDAVQRRWLPAFSVRTLLLLTTLTCGYVACWRPTKTQGVKDVAAWRDGAFAPTVEPLAPLIVVYEEVTWIKADGEWKGKLAQHYFFWFFGFVVKLPYTQYRSL